MSPYSWSRPGGRYLSFAEREEIALLRVQGKGVQQIAQALVRLRFMAGRRRHSAEDIVRKLRRADELTAAGKTGEEAAAEIGVSAATLYNWRRQYGGVDTGAAKELNELREQNAGEGRAAGDRQGKF